MKFNLPIPACGTWMSIKTLPPAGNKYLICADYGTGLEFDVAFFHGRQKDGSLKWTITQNGKIESALIACWAHIYDPVDLAEAKKAAP